MRRAQIETPLCTAFGGLALRTGRRSFNDSMGSPRGHTAELVTVADLDEIIERILEVITELQCSPNRSDL